MEQLFTANDFNAEQVKSYLVKRFDVNTTRSKDSKTARTNKYLSCFNAFHKRNPDFNKWSDIADKIPQILNEQYKTASTRQSILSMFKALFVEIGGMKEPEWKHNFGKLNTNLKEEYIKNNSEKELVGMTFKEAKAVKSEIPVINLYFKLYGAYQKFPCLRFGDWINASTEDNNTNNYIDIKTKTMLRRISKNQKESMLITLPNEIIKEIKRQKIKGRLFGDLTEKQILALVKTEHKDVVCNPRYFRTLYTTEILHKFKAKDIEYVKYLLQVADHSKEVAFTNYHKTQSALFRLLQTE